MDALHMLLQRVSVAKVTEPGPSPEQCRTLVSAALRAADHGSLQPWRFLFIEGAGREQLGELFVQASAEQTLSDSARERFRAMPLRAPCILVAIAHCQDHPKVPFGEQQFAAAAAVQNILNAAYALGLGAIWRTGELAYSTQVAAGLGLQPTEHIMGFVYLGTPINSPSLPKTSPPEDFFRRWPAE